MSGLFGSTLIKGNRLTDFAQSTATVGIVIPFGYGRFTTDGNVIWAPLPPVEHRTVTRQGKGGVKQENFTYTLSYAIAFAKGPIYGYWWIKRNGKVVWTQDPNAPIEDIEYAAKWRQRATFYYGTMDQMPDSTIESYEGSGRVSAHRQIAYIVVEDDDVTDGGGAVPTYEACVIRGAARSYTTPPYPVHAQDSLGVEISLERGGQQEWPVEDIEVAVKPLGGQIRNVLVYYDMQPEALGILGVEPLGGHIQDVMRYYDMQPESIKLLGVEPKGGDIWKVVLTYENYAPEALDVSVTPLGGDIS